MLVIQFITSVQRCKTEIPILLRGGQPTPDPDNVGTHNFSAPPQAVIFGRGFTAENIQEIRQQCGGSNSGLAWLQGGADGTGDGKVKPPDKSDAAALDAYADKTAAQVKSVLNELKISGKLGKDGVHYF